MPLYEQKPCRLCGIVGDHSTEDCRNYEHGCTYCKQPGHTAKACPVAPRCRRCQRKGHATRDCRASLPYAPVVQVTRPRAGQPIRRRDGTSVNAGQKADGKVTMQKEAASAAVELAGFDGEKGGHADREPNGNKNDDAPTPSEAADPPEGGDSALGDTRKDVDKEINQEEPASVEVATDV